MTSKKGVIQTRRHVGGEGGYSYYDDLTPAEMKARDDLQKEYEALLARQEAYMAQRRADVAAQQSHIKPERRGCVFAKSCKLPDAVINYTDPSGWVPTDSLSDYGNFAILGARKTDPANWVLLEKISGSVPLAMGGFALGGIAIEAAAVTGTTMLATTFAGVLALLWPSELADSALYTEDQLRSLKQARTRVRLRVEEQADGSLKGYGFYTGNKREWELVDVVQFSLCGSQQVADFGDGVELIWTPAVDPTNTLGIPPLKGAPHVPPIWIYPPTEAADSIIVNPVYPPDYKDFILVFPADSGVPPLYIVLSVPGHKYHPTPQGGLPAFPDATRVRSKTSVQGGGGLRPRWTDLSGFIYEWDRQHGTVEKYNKRGKHLGEFDPNTGEQNKAADKTRRVDP